MIRNAPTSQILGNSLRAVMAGSFEKQRVLTSSEYRVFAIVEDEIAAHGSGHRSLRKPALVNRTYSNR
jgi:hypothetical protein